MARRSLLIPLLVAAAAGCAPPEGACGFGERLTGSVCAPVDHFHINLDERLQMLNGTSRRGIGANACAFRALSHVPVVEDDNCATYVFEGGFALESFSGSAGGVIIGLSEPILMAPDDEGSGCYATDLFPARRELWSAGESFPVSALGGSEFPDFEVQLTAPETLAAELPGEASRSEALSLQWLPSDADIVVATLATHDEATNMTTNIGCVFNDADAAAEIPAEAMAELQSGAAEADVYVYRQNWQHVEPPGSDVVIEVVATSSVTRTVPLLD